MTMTAWSPGSACSGLRPGLFAFRFFDGGSGSDSSIWRSLAAAGSTDWASVVASWFFSGRARCAQLARASGSLSCPSSAISWRRRFSEASGDSLGGSKWICCQIGAREHYAVARALRRHDALGLLITDAWVRPGNPLGLLSAGLRARYDQELEGKDVYGPAVRNIAFELRARYSERQGWPLVMARNR
jgi:hypothetical protein